MDENILNQMIKSRNALKKKFSELKHQQNRNIMGLEETFKPITEPLHELVKNNKKIDHVEAKDYMNEKMEIKTKQNNSSLEFETPQIKKKRKFLFNNSNNQNSTPKFNDDYDDSKSFNWGIKSNINYEDDDNEQFYSQPAIEDDVDFLSPTTSPLLTSQQSLHASTSILDQSSKHENTKNFNISELRREHVLDKTYGPRKNEKGHLMLGSSRINVSNNKIEFDDGENWELTNGLYSLICHHIPQNYNANELKIYRQILFKTNVFRRNFLPNGQVKGTRAAKYSEIIKPLLTELPIVESTPKHSKTKIVGTGFMKLDMNKPNYVFWDNPNELVERLQLLIASESAGNTSHTNEITSIIEELREAQIIH